MVFHRRVLTEEWDARRFSEWMTEAAITEYEKQHGADSAEAKLAQGRHDLERLLSIERLTRSVRNSAVLTVVDFGCGWGRFVAFGQLLGFDAYGVDRSAARLGRTLSPDRVFASLDEYRMRVGKAPHAVTLFEVLEHLYAPAAILRAVHAAMVPGGILVAEVPDCEGLRQLTTRADLALADGLDHINAFDSRSLTALARQTGFEPVRAPTVQFSADWLRIAKREVRRVVDRFRKPRTQQFFVRVS